jgi:NAD(P)-dependent dehydrogenase (short-subunit alcohol dehydrogenase family)
VALIVDADGPLGRAAARAFASAGARLALAGADERATRDLAWDLTERTAGPGGGASSVPLDPLDLASCARAVGGIEARLGRLDVVCGAAAPLPAQRAGSRRLHEINEDEWDEAFAAGATRTVLPARAALRALRRHGGALIFLASSAVLVGTPGDTPLAAAGGDAPARRSAQPAPRSEAR